MIKSGESCFPDCSEIASFVFGGTTSQIIVELRFAKYETLCGDRTWTRRYTRSNQNQVGKTCPAGFALPYRIVCEWFQQLWMECRKLGRHCKQGNYREVGFGTSARSALRATRFPWPV